MVDVESRLSDLQLQVYTVIKTAGWEGATTDEIEVIVKRTHQSVSARVNELAEMKLIETRAARRKTRAGKPAAIYILYGLRRANPARDQADAATK